MRKILIFNNIFGLILIFFLIKFQFIFHSTSSHDIGSIGDLGLLIIKLLFTYALIFIFIFIIEFKNYLKEASYKQKISLIVMSFIHILIFIILTDILRSINVHY